MSRNQKTKERRRHPLIPLAVQEGYRQAGYWEGVTLPDIVAGWASRDAERIAVTGPVALSYSGLWERSRRLAGSLRAAGLEPGDFLLALMSSSWQ